MYMKVAAQHSGSSIILRKTLIFQHLLTLVGDKAPWEKNIIFFINTKLLNRYMQHKFDTDMTSNISQYFKM